MTITMGMFYLFEHNYLRDNSIIYINPFWKCASSTMLEIEEIIMKRQIKCVEPHVSRSIHGTLDILYPEVHITNQDNGFRNKDGISFRRTSRANDASSVYALSIAGKEMIFTGDLELNGFGWLSKLPDFSRHLRGCNYFCISHHGSINGHPTGYCHSIRKGITMAWLIRNNETCSILMGRDKAYPGIYD